MGRPVLRALRVRLARLAQQVLPALPVLESRVHEARLVPLVPRVRPVQQELRAQMVLPESPARLVRLGLREMRVHLGLLQMLRVLLVHLGLLVPLDLVGQLVLLLLSAGLSGPPARRVLEDRRV